MIGLEVVIENVVDIDRFEAQSSGRWGVETGSILVSERTPCRKEWGSRRRGKHEIKPSSATAG